MHVRRTILCLAAVLLSACETTPTDFPDTASGQHTAVVLARAIQDQLRNCWRIDPSARGAEKIVVEIRLLLSPDGSVNTMEVLDAERMVQDRNFRSVAENAKSAVARCSPFRLPVEKYEVWKQLTLRFDPRRAADP